MIPFGDGTGPRGEGPMTGRGLGYCAGGKSPGYMKAGGGRRAPKGRGRGRGRGMGRGRMANDALRKVGAL